MSVKHSGKLFVISGPSGTGKGTICKRLVENSDMDLSISATTRKPRPGEAEGENYFFLDRETFLDEIENGGFLEYAEVYGNFYGTPKQYVLDRLSEGTDVILEIDTQGALNIKKTYPDGVLIFILPPSLQELRDRLTGRATESSEAIERRLSRTKEEISVIGQYDYFIINDDLEDAVRRTETIIRAEHYRVSGSVVDLIKKYTEEDQ